MVKGSVLLEEVSVLSAAHASVSLLFQSSTDSIGVQQEVRGEVSTRVTDGIPVFIRVGEVEIDVTTCVLDLQFEQLPVLYIFGR